MFVFVNLIDSGVELVLSPFCIRKKFLFGSLMLPPLGSLPSPSPPFPPPPPKRVFSKAYPVGFPIQCQTIPQITLRLSLYRFLIMFQCRVGLGPIARMNPFPLDT